MGDKALVKEAITQLVYNKIEGALSEMKAGVNEKKFSKKLKKVSELLAKDIAKGIKEGKPEKLKPSKKSGQKKKDKSDKEPKSKKNKKEKKSGKTKLPKIKKAVITTVHQTPNLENNNA